MKGRQGVRACRIAAKPKAGTECATSVRKLTEKWLKHNGSPALRPLAREGKGKMKLPSKLKTKVNRLAHAVVLPDGGVPIQGLGRLKRYRAMQLSAHPQNGNNFQGDEKWQLAREILDNYHCLINRLGVPIQGLQRLNKVPRLAINLTLTDKTP